MPTYAVGDIQGCFDALIELLERVQFDPSADRLWSVGDLVNRGPDNLATLRWCYQHRDAVTVVLGNHDLHLLAASVGARKLGKSDNLEDVLNAPDRDELLRWLRHRPLLHREGSIVMTHAGIPAAWGVDEAASYAAEVEQVLQSEDHASFFQHMYGNEPARWSPHLRGMSRLRCITNHLTRMRYITPSGYLDFKNKGAAVTSAGNLCREPLAPWFTFRNRSEYTLLFGHWASIEGETRRSDILGLDTGCVWGGAMTLINLDTGERWLNQCQ